MPSNTIYVGRPSAWGNPFAVHGDWIVWAAVALGFTGDAAGRRSAALALYRGWMTRTAPAPIRVEGWHGAIGYEDGREVPTQDHVQGLASAVAGLMKGPKVPPRPDVAPLRGKNLACWCRLDQPCHADVLLELANA